MNNNKEDGASGGRTEDSRPDPLQIASADSNTGEINRTRGKDNKTKSVYYCCHCGNFPVGGPNIFCTNCESLKATLDDATIKFSKQKRYRNLLQFGIHVEYLNADDSTDTIKKEKRNLKRQELLEKVAALLNTGSGYILIHIVGLQKNDGYLGAFDGFAGKKIRSLINDGRLPDEVYRRRTLSELTDFSEFSDVLVLTIEEADFLCTSDFKTKHATDENIEDIDDLTLRQFLKKKKTFETDHHQIDFEKLGEPPSLFESREVQLKAIYQNGVGDEWLVRHLNQKLTLPQYVSAFSKNSNGGSFVAGVQEVKQEMYNGTTNTYVSKRLEYKSATVVFPKVFPSLIKEDLKVTCLVCDYEGNIEDGDDLVKTTLVPQMKDGQHHRNKHIIVISVRPVRGLVFYDPEGPVAYVISKNNTGSILDSIERLPFQKWFESMKPN